MKYIKSNIPKPRDAYQLSIKEVEQADHEANAIRASKHLKLIIEYCNKSINHDKSHII
jgi:hypothetical protein